MSPKDGGPFPKVRDAFEKIGVAHVATSALEAKQIGFLRPDDEVVLDKDQLLFKAKQSLLEYAKTYQPPEKREKISLPGKGGKSALMNALEDWKALGKVTEHDQVVAEKLAHVLTGADVTGYHFASEDHILDLEREAFLSLCGEKKTQERMLALLQTGRPLRN